MSYRIKSVKVKNFKCFNNEKFYTLNIDEDSQLTILGGPNGFGKTTFFDAIELILGGGKITRFKNIEHGGKSLGRNILLNEKDSNGFIVIELINNSGKTTTIFSVIDSNFSDENYSKSIKYFAKEIVLNTDDEIRDFIKEKIGEFDSDVTKVSDLELPIKYFNIYNYISQAESVHFLKEKIKDRTDTFEALLDLSSVTDGINYISENLIGNGKIIQKNLNEVESRLQINKEEYRKRVKNIGNNSTSMNYRKLINYNDEQKLSWDVENVVIEDKLVLDRYIKEIKGINEYFKNKKDFEIHIENKEIDKLLENSLAIKDYIEFKSFILENNKIDNEKISKVIESDKNIIDLYDNSEFFRKENKLSLYKREEILKIKKINPELINFDEEEVFKIIEAVNKLEKELGVEERTINSMSLARDELYKFYNQLNDNHSNCPYCNQSYGSTEELEEKFKELSEILKSKNSNIREEIVKKSKEVEIKINSSCDKILDKIKGINEANIDELKQKNKKYSEFIDDRNRKVNVEKIETMLNGKSVENELEIKELLGESCKKFSNSDFQELNRVYRFEEVADKYSNIIEIEQSNIKKDDLVKEKIEYLKNKFYSGQMMEVFKLKEELKEDYIKKYKLEKIKEKINTLKTIYVDTKESYKHNVMTNLKVPLLIYTGKILQDYQNGLGVFISEDKMRFVANGDAKHDVLNTFSSGQLSAFVLSFLFAMNKLYKTGDEPIKFLLIDDPVQTMDDINIASFVEVLRNDFSDRQVILSTHETDKENYIRYKYLKYGLESQSFDIKEELYT